MPEESPTGLSELLQPIYSIPNPVVLERTLRSTSYRFFAVDETAYDSKGRFREGRDRAEGESAVYVNRILRRIPGPLFGRVMKQIKSF